MRTLKMVIAFVCIIVYVIFLIVKMTGNVVPINLYLISGVSLLFTFGYFLHTRGKIRYRRRNLGSMWLFLIFGFFSLLWTRAPNYGMQKLFILSSLIIISWFISELIIRESYLFIKVLCVGAILILIWHFSVNGFASMDITNPNLRLDLKDNLNPIVIARYFCFSIITFIFYMKYNNKNSDAKKILILLLIIFTVVLAFLTGSKGPLLALIFSFVFPYALGKKFKFSGKYILVGGIIIVALLYFTFPIINSNSSSNLVAFIQHRYVGEHAEGSVTSRLDILAFALSHLEKSTLTELFLGHGLGDFGFAWSGGVDDSVYPHNIIVEILYETGILGLFLFGSIVVEIIRINLKRGNKLFTKDYKDLSLFYFLTIFYFSLFAAMTSGDMAGNFFVFVAPIFILKIDKMHFKAQDDI